MPGLAGTLIEIIQSIEGTRFPGDIGRQQRRLLLQHPPDIANHFLTAHHQRRQTILLHLAQLTVEQRQLFGHRKRLFQLPTNTQAFGRGDGFQLAAYTLLQHLLAAFDHHALVAFEGEQGV